MKTLNQVLESLFFAIGALRENLLRTTLSLLGITVGIFAIIGVLTLVDALDRSIKESVSFLGDKVMYVEKWPWGFGEAEYPWWKYMKRPVADEDEYEFLAKNLTRATAVSIFAVRGNLTAQYKSNSIKPIFLQGCSYSHNNVSEMKIEEGRYFSIQEVDKASPVALIGANLKEQLFENENPIGKFIRVRGMKVQVIAVLKKEGDNLLGAPSADGMCVVPYGTLRKAFASGRRGPAPRIALLGEENDIGMVELEAEVRGLMRAKRGLKPLAEDNFAINRSEALIDFLNTLIDSLTVAGWFIGSFSMLVGGFGIANIMFVSVKERTNLIGIQKSLGAKNYFILCQFLFEAILLSIIGGLGGLILVSILGVFSTESFEITLTSKNILIGLTVSSILGILAGLIPAYSASRLDPVIAIRSK